MLKYSIFDRELRSLGLILCNEHVTLYTKIAKITSDFDYVKSKGDENVKTKDWCTLIRTNRSIETLLCMVWINMHQSLSYTKYDPT